MLVADIFTIVNVTTVDSKAPFFVLIGAQMPSILVEVGFLSNRDEEKRLRSNNYLDGLAWEIATGVDHYAKSLR